MHQFTKRLSMLPDIGSGFVWTDDQTNIQDIR